jgi:hypothetical protein
MRAALPLRAGMTSLLGLDADDFLVAMVSSPVAPRLDAGATAS